LTPLRIFSSLTNAHAPPDPVDDLEGPVARGEDAQRQDGDKDDRARPPDEPGHVAEGEEERRPGEDK
jgi:hypothetical protein